MFRRYLGRSRKLKPPTPETNYFMALLGLKKQTHPLTKLQYKKAHYSQYFRTSLSKLLNSFIWGGRFSILKSASKFAIKIIGPIKITQIKKYTNTTSHE
jgi:hypothetical protein